LKYCSIQHLTYRNLIQKKALSLRRRNRAGYKSLLHTLH
jgi:hypothetical protein